MVEIEAALHAFIIIRNTSVASTYIILHTLETHEQAKAWAELFHIMPVESEFYY